MSDVISRVRRSNPGEDCISSVVVERSNLTLRRAPARKSGIASGGQEEGIYFAADSRVLRYGACESLKPDDEVTSGGRVICNVASSVSLGVAHRRPLCDSTMERLIARPMPGLEHRKLDVYHRCIGQSFVPLGHLQCDGKSAQCDARTTEVLETLGPRNMGLDEGHLDQILEQRPIESGSPALDC
jgi:hypothetical protein